MRKLFTLLSLFVLASMILSACGPTPAATDAPAQPEQPAATDAPSQPEATEAPAKEAVLRINTGTYPDVIDPQKSSFVNEIGHLDKIYMGLSTLNEKLETVPGAADSWTFNDDATQLVFTLKPGLVYSDGSVLNAKRFEYSFQRNIDPTTAGEYASITDEIVGAPEWRAADTAAEGYDPETFKAALGVKASHADGSACADYEDTACDTLTLNFSKPAPYFATIAGITLARGRAAGRFAAGVLIAAVLIGGSAAWGIYWATKAGSLSPDDFYNSVAGNAVVVGGLLAALGAFLGAATAFATVLKSRP